jgi:DNA polymerase-3 subunit delta
MPVVPASTVRKQVAARQPDPVYLIVGDDEAEMSRLAGEIGGLVEDELRAFNSDRFYAGERGVTPAAIVEAASTLPMMSDRRVVTVLRAERILKPKRRGKAAAEEPGDDVEAEAPTELDVLEAYIRNPVPQTTLVMVASDVDRTRKLYKTLQKQSTIVECWGLRPGRDARVDLREVARNAEILVKQATNAATQQIEPAAARLIAERAGTDIARLRGEVDRLLLYALGEKKIGLDEARQIVGPAALQDDWAIANAIEAGQAAEALRQLALTLESGGVSYQILGQLAWFVREKLVVSDPRRVPAAIEALFRTDLELKSSGDPRVLLERLVVQLCRG